MLLGIIEQQININANRAVSINTKTLSIEHDNARAVVPFKDLLAPGGLRRVLRSGSLDCHRNSNFLRVLRVWIPAHGPTKH